MESASRYEIIDTIASGDYAVVYRARDRELGREVAVKQIHQQFLDNPRQLERYWREAHLLASLQHPNVLTVYDVARARGWLILELMRGSLQQTAAAGPIDLDFLRFAVAGCLNALQFLHANGVIHGDVKPSNLLVDAQGRIKLGDFGLARRANNEQGSLLRGTTKYMAPELVAGQVGAWGPASDLYSLGFAAYELMCGPHFEQLFPGLGMCGGDRQIAWLMWHAAPDRKLPEVHRVLEGVPPVLAHVVEKLAAKDPSQRYATAEEALEDLRRATLVPSGAAGKRDAPRPRGRRLLRISSVASFVCSLLLSVWILIPPVKQAAAARETVDAEGVVRTVLFEERALIVETPDGHPAELKFRPDDRFYVNQKEALFRDLAPEDRIHVEVLRDASGQRLSVVYASRPERQSGRIKAVAAEAGRFTLAFGEPEQQLEIRVPGTVQIRFNGQETVDQRPVTLRDLEAGDQVVVVHVGEETGRAATELSVQRLVALEGTLRGIDLGQGKLTIGQGEGAHLDLVSLPLARECEVTINDRRVIDERAVRPEDLRPGDQVRLVHDTQVVRVDAHRIIGESGVVQAAGPKMIEVQLDGQGKPTAFVVGQSCAITISGEPAGAEDLRPGDQVDVTHDSPGSSSPQALSIAARRLPDSSRWAILIGVQDCDDRTLPAPPHAADDARLLEETLVKRYRVPANQALRLADASLVRMREAVTSLLQRVQAGGRLVVYCAAHAARDSEGQVYLAPKEFRREQPAATGLALQWLVDQLEACPAKEKLLLLDAGYGAPSTAEGPSSEEAMLSLAAPPGQAALRTVTAIASCAKGQRGQVAADQAHGLFARHVALGYSGKADKNRDGQVEAGELVAFLGTYMASGGSGGGPQTARLILPNNKPPRLSEEARRAIRELAGALGQSDIKLAEVRQRFDAAQGPAGKEIEPKLLLGLGALKARSRADAQQVFEELAAQDPGAIVPRQALAWMRFERKQHAAGLDGLADLVGALPRPKTPAERLPDATGGLLTWAGELREFAASGDDRNAVPEQALQKLDAAVAALGPAAEAAYQQGRAHSREVREKLDAQIAGAPDEATRIRLRIGRYQLGAYASFPYDTAIQAILKGLEQ